MTDTITESFCERCGARYSFEPTASRRRGGFGRVRVLTRGLKNYVANDGMPMDEAMAAARSDEARGSVSRQLDAFHKTFNFCLSCRQYTCANCWNERAVECLTCAPDLSREVLPAPFPDLPLAVPDEPDDASRDGEAVTAAAWPTVDLARAKGAAAAVPDGSEPVEEPEVLARVEAFVAAPAGSGADELTATELAEIESALAAVQPAPEAAPEPVAVEMAEATAEPVAVEMAEAVAEPVEAEPAAEVVEAEPAAEVVAAEPAAEVVAVEAPEPPADALVERVTIARGQTRSLLGRFRPGRHAAAAPTADAAALAATVSARSTSSPAEPAADLVPAPVAAADSQPAPAPADTIEQPTWQIVAPDAAPAPRPDWPDAPAWPSPDPQAIPTPSQLQGPSAAPWAARLATARPEPTSIWAASSQEVLAAPGPVAGAGSGPAVQACVSCGLSLSANARFCRRCGSRQG